MKLLIWGAGAIGGTMGAYLARAGHDVTLVDRAADHVEAINANGLKITGPVDEFTVRVPAFTPDTISGQFPYVLLYVRAHDKVEAARALLPHLSANGYVVSVQNGLNELVSSQIVGREAIIGCFVSFFADYVKPGVVRCGDRRGVAVGALDGQMTPHLQYLAVQELAEAFFRDNEYLFASGGAATRNIWPFLWGKLSYDTLLLAIALTDDSIADALAYPQYRDLYLALVREPLRVARAHGIWPEWRFDGFYPNAFVPEAGPLAANVFLDNLLEFNRRSYNTHSEYWSDLAVRKRHTEVDSILGPTVRLGTELGIPTPLTARLVELIHEIEDGRRAQETTNLDELECAMGLL